MPTSKDISRALARIRSALPVEKRVDSARRDIRLGLERITRIIPEKQYWTGIHVAGTNGKGSICALLSGMLRRAGIGHGVFLSPAMPEPHNGILINGRFMNKRMFETLIEGVQSTWRNASTKWVFNPGEDPGPLSPFEVETAAAFRAFETMRLKYGIVEVGMGGATDATNAMKKKAITIISKIDLDHQEYLGNTIEEIAKVKAGIMKPGVPCVVDHSNPSTVLRVLQQHADSIGAPLNMSSDAEDLVATVDRERFFFEEYERNNLLCATTAFRLLFPHLELDLNKLLASKPHLPGRKERVKLTAFSGREASVLADGAHNLLGIEALVKHVDHKLRQDDQPVTWVMGLSNSTGKPFAKMIETLVRPGDNFAFVEYKQGRNDPPPASGEMGRDLAGEIIKDESRIYGGEPKIAPALLWACDKAKEGPLVVTGSLYLIRELYKLKGIEPQGRIKTKAPSRSQLWNYIEASKERPLTPEEAEEFKRARRQQYLYTGQIVPNWNSGKQQPLTVSSLIRHAQRTAAFHKKEADAIRVTITSIERDIRRSGGNSPGLGSSLPELKQRLEEHLRAYNRAMTKARGHDVDPEKKYMSFKDVYGQEPRQHQGQVWSVLRKHGLRDTWQPSKKKALQRNAEAQAQAEAEAEQQQQQTPTSPPSTNIERPSLPPEDFLERELMKGRKG